MEQERFPRRLIKKVEGIEFPLSVLSAIRELREYLDRAEEGALLKARELGASATLMADALGVTRQGIYHKLKVLEERKASAASERASDDTIVIPDLAPKQE